MASRFSFNSSSGSDHSPHANRTAGVKRGSSDTDENDNQLPLTTNKLGNGQEHCDRDVSAKKHKQSQNEDDVMSTLLAKLQESQGVNSTSNSTKAPGNLIYRHPHAHVKSSSGGSPPVTPDSDRVIHKTDSDSDASLSHNPTTAEELAALKRQLATRDHQLATMQQELEQSKLLAMAAPASTEAPVEVRLRGGEFRRDISDGTISRLQHELNVSTRPVGFVSCSAWNTNEAEQSDDNDSAIGLVPGRNMWSSNAPGRGLPLEKIMVSDGESPQFTTAPASVGDNFTMQTGPFAHPASSEAYHSAAMNAPLPQRRVANTLRVDTASYAKAFPHANPPVSFTSGDLSMLQTCPPSRTGSAVDPRFMAYNSFSMGSPSMAVTTGLSPPVTPLPFNNNMSMFPPHNQYVPRPIGTRPSPPGSDYNSGTANPWNNQPSVDPTESTYIPPVEPLNYRRLLERNASCNWDYIIDKILQNNDQQASMFLQQKIKQAAPEHKIPIVQRVISKAYPLMMNRFGNFLIQRCFENSTPEQIVAFGNLIRGNTLSLSMDPFACHVVQKAFDYLPEEHKAMMVHELLRNITQTICHRYSSHVWQKLFELRWSDSPPQIMKYVNEALSGMWHTVALGETGSLVVQNIFENCLEEDKRPCIDETLNAIDEISRGQYGNWCIQHICEQGAPRDRTWAIDHILRNAQEYSTDQYGSKVVEKCLKIGGDEFMDRYLDRVCEARADRPRQAIIDIAGDQYGNYLVQWILVNASPQHREIVSTHVRKHMVSLRGSKYGSRVAMLCCNPQSATRPGAPAGFQLNRFSSTTSSNSGLNNGSSGASNGRAPYNSTYR